MTVLDKSHFVFTEMFEEEYRRVFEVEYARAFADEFNSRWRGIDED